MQTVVRIQFGSYLYGTATPASDTDYKSVHLPDARDILLQRVAGSLGERRDKAECRKNLSSDVDDESYSLQRYLGLIADGQTVAVDMLFAPQPVVASDLWRMIQKNKSRLLTRRSVAFVGYCRTQANKYGIKGSRVAATKEAAELFSREYTRLGPTAKVHEIAELLPALVGEHTALIDLPVKPGAVAKERFIECCNRKISFNNTIKTASEVFRRIYDNYGARARLAETNEGVDWKALSHAVRVGEEAIELLATGHITFPLKNAAHILDIKQGGLAYDEVASEIEGLLEQVEREAERSVLRDTPDQEWIDALV
jgi:hypothetical protein